MKKDLKKHILSKYASSGRENKLNKGNTHNAIGPTILTENIENSDPDDFKLYGPTHVTKNMETSDADDFVLAGPTILTHAVENSDLDECKLLGKTVETRVIEISDPDELYVGTSKKQKILDIDEFLLI